jgi:hypothetical protein
MKGSMKSANGFLVKVLLKVLPKLLMNLVLSLLLILSGCSSLSNKESVSDTVLLSNVNTEIVFLGKDNAPLSATFFPQDIVLFFPPIPGQLFGFPLEKTVYMQRLSHQERKFILPLDEIVGQVQSYATQLNQGPETEGLTIAPAVTKLVRIGSFAYDENTKEAIGNGGFTDRKSGDSLILVYVDQACKLFGSLIVDADEYHHQIDLPTAGFHWLRVEKTIADHYAVYFYAPPEGVYFSVKISLFLET